MKNSNLKDDQPILGLVEQSVPNPDAYFANPTMAEIFDFLIEHNVTEQRIVQITGLDSQSVQRFSGSKTLPRNSGNSVERKVWNLFLKERIKALYRYSPFSGRTKAAEYIGIDLETFRTVYRTLIECGELRIRNVVPDWSTTGRPIREHIVP
jgi:hypothetical protein